MLILNAQELESQGIPYLAASRILFQERLLIKGQSFSQRVRQVAINLYAEYLRSGVICLLVESTEQLTFWRELEPTVHGAAIASAKKPGFHQGKPQPMVHASDDVIRIDFQHRNPADVPEKKQSVLQNQTALQAAIQVRYRGAIVTLPQIETAASDKQDKKQDKQDKHPVQIYPQSRRHRDQELSIKAKAY